MEPTLTARFDYFRAAIAAKPQVLVDGYAGALRLEPRTARALYGYTSAVGLHRGDDPELIVFFGGEVPLIQASGYAAQSVYEVTKKIFPDYRPSRLDVAVDFPEADWFEVIHKLMRTLSHQRGTKHSIMGDWETPGSPDGRTVYSGSRTSVAYRRLYEFRKYHGYGPHVRYELEIKPKHNVRNFYAGMGPREILATDGYTVELMRRLGVHIDRLKLTPEERGVPDLERWFAHLVHQHGPKLIAYITQVLRGDVSELGPAIVRAVEARAAMRQRMTEQQGSTGQQGSRVVTETTL